MDAWDRLAHRIEKRLNEPVSRREVVGSALLAIGASLLADTFTSIKDAIKKAVERKDVLGIQNAIQNEFGMHYTKFIEDHKGEFWREGKDGFDLRKHFISTYIDDAQPATIEISLYELDDNDGGSYDDFSTSSSKAPIQPKQPVVRFLYNIEKGKPFDYKRDFEQPLFAGLSDKLPSQ